MQALCKDARMLPAGGAPEIEVCQQLQKFGRKETGLDQYAIAKFAESLEVTTAASMGCHSRAVADINLAGCGTCYQVRHFKLDTFTSVRSMLWHAGAG